MIEILFFSISLSAPYYIKIGTHLEVNGDGEITSNDIKVKSQYSKMETCSVNNGITVIGVSAFSGCSLLHSINLPDSLLQIKNAAFMSTSLTNITIPRSVTYINPEKTFYSLNFIEFIINENSVYSTYDQCLYDKNLTFLVCCPSSKNSIKFPTTVTELGSFSFFNSHLKEIQFPDSVIKINKQTFVDPGTCYTIVFGIDCNLTELPSYGFFNVLYTSIRIPPKVTKLCDDAFYSCYLTNFGFIGDSKLNTLGAESFKNCGKLVNISLPKSIESISGTAFSGCSSLQLVSIEEGSPFYKTSPDGVLFKGNYEEIIFASPSCKRFAVYDTTRQIGSHITQKLVNVSIDAINISDDNENIKYLKGVFYGKNYLTADHAIGSIQVAVIHKNTTTLSSGIFSGIYSLTSVSFEEGSQCRYIYDSAFSGCVNLVSALLPTTVEYFGKAAFAKSGITSFMFPSRTKATSESMFNGCPSLKNVTFPSNSTLKKLIILTFYNTSFTSIALPNDLEEIQERTFAESKVESMTIPNSVKIIEQYAFYKSNIRTLTTTTESSLTALATGTFSQSMLESIIIPPNVSTIQAETFSGCKFLTCVEFLEPASIEEIPSLAFSGCSSLKSFTIPSSIKLIDATSFYNCFNLTEFIVRGDNFKFVNNSLYSYDLEALYVFPPGITQGSIIASAQILKANAFGGDKILERLSFDVGSNVRLFGRETFFGCTSLSSLYLLASLRIIENNCFRSCSSLANITFEDGSNLNTVGSSTFDGCSMLERVDFGADSQLQTIGELTFANCGKLVSISIPCLVSSIGPGAFSGCTSLQRVIFENSSASLVIPASCFYQCTSLKSIIIVSSIAGIESSAFQGCNKLQNVIFKAGVKYIRNGAFQNCNLGILNLPSSVEIIGENAFASNVNLKTVILESKAITLELNCFSLCNSIDKFVFCSTSRIVQADVHIFGGTTVTDVFGLKAYPLEQLDGYPVQRVMDRCLIFPSAVFTPGSGSVAEKRVFLTLVALSDDV